VGALRRRLLEVLSTGAGADIAEGEAENEEEAETEATGVDGTASRVGNAGAAAGAAAGAGGGSSGGDSGDGSGDGSGGGSGGGGGGDGQVPRRRGRQVSSMQLSEAQQEARSVLDSLSNMVDAVPKDLTEQLNNREQHFKVGLLEFTGSHFEPSSPRLTII
jgi:hypothetical protein